MGFEIKSKSDSIIIEPKIWPVWKLGCNWERGNPSFYNLIYNDGQGIRYLIPELFIKIENYKGGLRYLNWFNKNFPDDGGYPIFLFEWACILFKCDRLLNAEEKVYSAFFSNTYLFDIFLEKEPLQPGKYEGSNWEFESLTDNFQYSHKHTEFIEFAGWAEAILSNRKFLDTANEFIEIKQKLKNEPVGKNRTELVNRLPKIQYPSFGNR